MIIIQSILAIVVGISLGLGVTFFAGENPWVVLQALLNSSLGSAEDLGWTLFYTTPIAFCGLSVGIAFRAGLFNIGAEGQLAMGAFGAAAVGILLPDVPAPFSILLGFIAAFAAGGFWGWLAGWLKAARGSHEVITTMMLNFVAAGLTSWATLYVLRNTASQNPETLPVGSAFLLQGYPNIFGDSPFNISFLFAILSAIALWIFLQVTVPGFEMRALGQSESAARGAGIKPESMWMKAMFLSGGLAGLCGVNEVMGNAGCFKPGFSPGFGFIGIAVALVGRGHPIGILCAAFLFGILQRGASGLDLVTNNVTRDLSQILQSLIILSVVADGAWQWLQKGRRRNLTSTGDQI